MLLFFFFLATVFYTHIVYTMYSVLSSVWCKCCICYHPLKMLNRHVRMDMMLLYTVQTEHHLSVHCIFYMPWGHSMSNCRRSRAATTLHIRAKPAVLLMELSFPLAYISVGRSVCSHAYKSPSMKAHIYSGHLIMSRVVEDSHSGFPNGRSWKNKTRNLILTTSIAAGDNKTCLDCNSQSHHLLEEKYLCCQPIICGDYLFFKCQNHQLQKLSSQDQESPLNAF